MDPLATADIALVRADNPGPFTLEGTNSWLLGREPVLGRGPRARRSRATSTGSRADAQARGGVGGIALTHGHGDHTDGVAGLLARVGDAPVAAAAWEGATVRLADGDAFGPLQAIATPGHAPDHLAFLAGRVLFTGDAVLGHGSVYVAPDPGALRGYLRGARPAAGARPRPHLPRPRPARHRAARQARRVPRPSPRARAPARRRARRRACATPDDLLDRVWSDVPSVLRPAAAVTLAAHLDKLAEEGRLPADVDRGGAAAVR